MKWQQELPICPMCDYATEQLVYNTEADDSICGFCNEDLGGATCIE